MRRVAILGSTGSVGKASLDIVRNDRDRFKVVAIAAYGNDIDQLASQAIEFGPEYISISDKEKEHKLKSLIRSDIKVLSGADASLNLVKESAPDFIVAAMVGIAGLFPIVAGIDIGADLAIANKEALLSAGRILMKRAKDANLKIIPVDSEHSAIFQIIEKKDRESIKKIVLTASGGAFRDLPAEALSSVTVEEALKHPNWQMGKKITIDSATMINKALEIIEARYLFDFDGSMIDVLIHAESIVHAMVEFKDRSFMAHLGLCDMRLPISYAFYYPNTHETDLPELDLSKIGKLSFCKPDLKKYKGLKLAYDILKSDNEAAMIALSSSNEIAVDCFLKKQIRFTDIVNIVSEVLEKKDWSSRVEIEEVTEIDKIARKFASEIARKISL